MCTLIVIHRRIPGSPLVVAANRDEYYDRLAVGPAIWGPTLRDGRRHGSDDRRGAILAPRDLRAGGTWLGLNPWGVFAALTNRPTDSPDPGRRSRGELVLDALEHESAEQAARSFEKLECGRYNPCNLVVADRERAFVMSYRERAETLQELLPGVHVIGNADPDDRGHPKTARILERVEALANCPGERVLDALQGACAEHTETTALTGPTGSTCVHLDGYGTRSSLLLQLSDAGSDAGERYDVAGSDIAGQGSVLRYAEGAPCQTPYEDYSALLGELSHRASYTGEETQARKAS